MKTLIPKADLTARKWYVVDLENKTLGRVAVKVVDVLRGKNKPVFTPHLDMGDFVVAINAAKIKVTGNKKTNLFYSRYSGYPGGLTRTSLGNQLAKKPELVFTHAVSRMMPKTRLGKKQLKKLLVYPGAAHPHKAQKPEPLNFG
jgi:large subunit ribosomal protein L13